MVKTRLLYLDYARAFLFLWMAFDHALHAYADYFGAYWFIQDTVRTWIFDGFYVVNQAVIMPMIFFISGAFVVPSLERRGFVGYTQERLIRLGIPFCFGILFILPALTYPRFVTAMGGEGMSYVTYWFDIFFTHTLQAGPLWVMYGLFLYGLIVAGMVTLFPNTKDWMAATARSFERHPVKGGVLFLILGALILGISDLIWGTPWWIGFGRIFYLQGSRFLLYFLYFIAGAACYTGGLLGVRGQNTLLPSLHRHLKKYLGLFALLAFVYGGYVIFYMYDGAFSDVFRSFLVAGADGETLWSVFWLNAPLVLIRTTLFACVTLLGGAALLAVFYAYGSQHQRGWVKIAKCTYAFFLIHESVMVWMQWGLRGVVQPPAVKMISVFSVGTCLSYALAYLVTTKSTFVRRILLGKGVQTV